MVAVASQGHCMDDTAQHEPGQHLLEKATSLVHLSVPWDLSVIPGLRNELLESPWCWGW